MENRFYFGGNIPILRMETPPDPRTGPTSIALEPLGWIHRITSHLPDPGKHCQRFYLLNRGRLRPLSQTLCNNSKTAEHVRTNNRTPVGPVFRSNSSCFLPDFSRFPLAPQNRNAYYIEEANLFSAGPPQKKSGNAGQRSRNQSLMDSQMKLLIQ
jgi:hypothetical protein